MLWLKALFPSTAARWLVALLLLAAAGAWCVKVGINHESNRRDALDLRAQQQADKDFITAIDKGRAATALLQAANAGRAALQNRLKQRTKNAQETDLFSATCAGQQASPAQGVSVVNPATCYVTRLFVKLWNDPWRGGGHHPEPIQGDPTGITAEERTPTPIGPRQLLENQQDNAFTCVADRARLDSLIDLLGVLEADWDRRRR
jgi:hypothetical protein